MTGERERRVAEIVEQALGREGEARRAFVEEACGGDAELRAEVERVLAREGTGDPDFLEPPALAGDEPARHVLGEFELVQELGRGGMGVVYLARQARLGRDVAVKVLVENPTTSERDIERFHREARATGKLRHPGIVQVFADGQLDHTHWFAMEYVEGHDLQRELALQRQEGVLKTDRPFLPRPHEPQHAARVARLCADVADALQHAHEHGLVHRDIKPQNLLLQPDGRVQIGDFGLVRDESLGSITRTDVVAGTPHYMSPEQARVSSISVDHRTDVYSLGVVLYELATLKRPFEGKTSADVITKIRDSDPRSLRSLNPRLPRDLETICLKAMAKDPRARYATAGELREDLERFLAHQSIRARPPSALDRAGRWLRRRRVHVGAVLLVAAGLWIGSAVTGRIAAGRTHGVLSVAARGPDGAPVAGTVALRRIEPVTGVADEPRGLGRLPLDAVRVEPGYYRVVVELEGWGERIFAREIEAREEVRVEAEVAPRQRDRDGMVRIEGGRLALDDGFSPLVALDGMEVEVEGFLMDATEVSNAEYRRFLEATGHPAPDHWASIGPELDDRPVAKVSWYDARAYAEWAGKHLPSFAEWTWAARGPEGRIYPWEGAVRGELRGNADHPRVLARDEPMDVQYRERTAPVDSHPEARTPTGLYHMFGNVQEFTETPPADLGADGPYARTIDRIVAGQFWAARRHTLASLAWLGKERTFAEYATGFRCIAALPPED